MLSIARLAILTCLSAPVLRRSSWLAPANTGIIHFSFDGRQRWVPLQ